MFKTSFNADLKKLLKEVLIHIEKNHPIPDHVLYLNASYINNKNTLIELIKTHLSINSSTTLVGQKTYQCIWAFSENNGYEPVTPDLLKPKKIRNPLFKVFYGLGTIYLTSDLRKEDSGNQITGIFEIDETTSVKKIT